MQTALLLLPDFALILLGYALKRSGKFAGPFWDGLEKLIFFVLLPTLLFTAIAKAKIDPIAVGPTTIVGLGAALVGIALAEAGRHWFTWAHADARATASSLQIGFRFSTYVGLAIASRLVEQGQTRAMVEVAVLAALVVPIANVFAVGALARLDRNASGGSVARQVVSNPLVIATLSGLLWSLALPPLPAWTLLTLDRVGQASIALGLMAAGAGMIVPRNHLLNASAKLPLGWVTWILGVKHLAMPLAAIGIAWAMGYAFADVKMGILFAALPTAASAYVLATRMGGDGPLVARLVTLSTLIGIASLPLWVAWLG